MQLNSLVKPANKVLFYRIGQQKGGNSLCLHTNRQFGVTHGRSRGSSQDLLGVLVLQPVVLELLEINCAA